MVTDVTGVLLAGGKSRRMGQDKRFLELGQQTLFARSLAVLRTVFQAVLIVIAQDSEPIESDVPVLRDLVPNCGSLGGLYTGLHASTTPFVFAVACDMPFLSAQAVEFMVAMKEQADVVMVRRDTGLQPLHALYGKRCLPSMEEMIRNGELKIQRIVERSTLATRIVTEAELSRVDPDGRSFLNVNTPADLEAAKKLLAGLPGSQPRL